MHSRSGRAAVLAFLALLAPAAAGAAGTGDLGPAGPGAESSFVADLYWGDSLATRNRFSLNLLASPDGGCCSTLPMRWALEAFVPDRHPCSHDDSVVHVETDSSEAVRPALVVVEPDLSSAGGTVRGRALSPCSGETLDFFVEFSVQASAPATATGPEAGAKGFHWTKRRPAVGWARFCFDNQDPDDTCQGFGEGLQDSAELRRTVRAGTPL